MPDNVFPTSINFFLGPRNHPEKGIVWGSDSGTCLTLPAVFSAFRKTTRLHELPVEKLVLRTTTVASITKGEGEEISKAAVQNAFDLVQPPKGDALLIKTSWGDKPDSESYVLGSPHFSLEAAQYLAQRMSENQSDLLLVDTPLLGWPDKHLIPEWFSLLPTPAAESAEARMYLRLYDSDKAGKDFAVEIEFARLGVNDGAKVDPLWAD